MDTIMTKNKTTDTYKVIKRQLTIAKIWQFLRQNRYGHFTRLFRRVHLKPGGRAGTRLQLVNVVHKYIHKQLNREPDGA